MRFILRFILRFINVAWSRDNFDSLLSMGGRLRIPFGSAKFSMRIQ
jgi:hypothetical protein